MEMDIRWNKAMEKLEADFGTDLDLQSVLFIIGLQELGFIKHKINKRQKLEVLHVAVCRLLSDYGFYEFEGYDVDKWPHYKRTQKLPHLKSDDQQKLLKEAVVIYLEKI
ncbi:MAG: hypothetical protein ACJASM_000188 [Salibacteraceae bacterium]|jgi:hypothetical protein|tara:strand:+ start:3078 stop:3404 length:327 start_codon:yes stop_codon:yes gene_type:complete